MFTSSKKTYVPRPLRHFATNIVQFDSAKAAYQRVLDHSPTHAKVLQQLGWLHHQQSSSYEYQDRAIQYLEKSVNAGMYALSCPNKPPLTATDNTDAQSWYLLGRCYMSQQKYPKAYEAYQQAVYRDGKNPTFWCSIGVLYYQINQYRDALDAYSRAIRLNPYISEVWYDLGTLVSAPRPPILLHLLTHPSTSRATTKFPMPSTPTKGLPSSTPATRTSRPVFSFLDLATAVLLLLLLSLLMSTPRPTRLPVPRALPVLNGEVQLPNLLLAVLLPLLRVPVRTGLATCPT